jgi:hypothetical protein
MAGLSLASLTVAGDTEHSPPSIGCCQSLPDNSSDRSTRYER